MTPLENDAFRYLTTYSILFASSVNFLIPWAPNSMLCTRCSLRSLKKINIVRGDRERGMGRREMFPKRSKIEFYYQWLDTFDVVLAVILITVSLQINRKAVPRWAQNLRLKT